MTKQYLFILITVITTLPVFSQVYKCGVTVDTYVKEQGKTIKSVCSDKDGNIYYLKSNGIYKNNVSWIQYKPDTYTSYFSFPFYLATDQTNLYVYDNTNMVFKITPAGVVTALAGIKNVNSSVNGPAASATFSNVTALCADKTGNVFVAENTKIRKIGIDGNVTTFAGKDIAGTTNGDITVATFQSIRSITCDHSGNLFVVDFSKYIRKVNAVGTVSNYVGGHAYYYVDDINYKAGFSSLTCIYYGNDNYLYVSDENCIRRISSTGETITLVGGKVNDNNSYNYISSKTDPDRVYVATAITLAPNGKLYFYTSYTYSEYSIIRSVTVDNACEQEKRIVETMCGNGHRNANIYGNGKNAEFELPQAITMDKFKNLYIGVSNYNMVYKMTPSRDVSLFYTPPSGLSAAPRSLVTDANGTLYISYGTRIEAVSSTGTYIKTYRSNVGESFNAERMVIDNNGDLLFTDRQYDNIRKLNLTTGSYTTIAGGTNYVSSGISEGYVDGTAANSRFTNPTGIDVDSKGNIYIVDEYNSIIRKISTDGSVSTVIGGTVGNTDERFWPRALQVDYQDNIYVSDRDANVIRKINVSTNTMQIVAGNMIDGKAKYIDGKASIANFDDPTDIYYDTDKNLWVADMTNDAIRRITGLDASITTAVITPSENTETRKCISYPNPVSNLLHFDEERSYEIYDLNGVSKLSGKDHFADISFLTEGLYFIRFEEINVTEKIIKR